MTTDLLQSYFQSSLVRTTLSSRWVVQGRRGELHTTFHEKHAAEARAELLNEAYRLGAKGTE